MPDDFIHEITVGWGDCDPARIAYTGRIPNFGLDAIEAWWQHIHGEGWFVSNLDSRVASPFAHLSFDFLAPITPRHKLLCQVELVGLGNTSITFRVTGRQNGVDCFRAKFVEVFADPETLKKAPIPPAYRARMEAVLVAA